jgi:hypothetical protein
MLHNLFHSLPWTHSRDPNLLTLQIWLAPQHMWNHSLNTLCLLWQIHLPSFSDTWFFLISSLQCLHTFLVTKVYLVGVSHFSSRFLSSPASLSAIVSPFPFFCTPYIHTYHPTIDIYGFANFSFFWYTKFPYAHCFFETVTFADIVSIFFTFLTSYHPFFHQESFLFFATSSASFFWRSNTLLAFSCFICLLIDINPPSLPSNCSLGRACITTHTTHTTSVH